MNEWDRVSIKWECGYYRVIFEREAPGSNAVASNISIKYLTTRQAVPLLDALQRISEGVAT